MRIQRFVGTAAMLGVLGMMTSGCFATRMVRTDTITSYDLVRAQPVAEVAPSSTAVAQAPAPSTGTLVVEALVVPPPPAASAAPSRPVRLPDSVAATDAPAPTPAWDPLPSYVAQFARADWVRRPLFGGSAQVSTGFRRWAPFPGRSAMTVPYGYGASSTTGAYGSASPHFSSPPSFSGSVSSHFSGGYPGSGY